MIQGRILELSASMWHTIVLLGVLCCTSGYCGAESGILGVAPNKLVLYEPKADFTCLDGSVSIPFGAVNDDFCDCPDGSDEPGTSACGTSVFHCLNKGFYPLDIPSSRVDDGICDCCDGSDEYVSKNCTDVCEVLGAKASAEAERAAELMNKGNALRLEMSEAGKRMRRERRERLARLTEDLGAAEKAKEEAESIKGEIETKESAALQVYREAEAKAREEAAERERSLREEEAKTLFMETDTDGNAVLTAAELTQRIASLKSSEGKPEATIAEEVKFIMNSKEEMTFSEFFEGTWSRLKSSLTSEEQASPPPVEEHPETETEAETEHDEEAEEPEEEEEDKSGGEEAEQYGPPPEPTVDTEYDEETRRLMDEANTARHNFEEAERRCTELRRDIEGAERSLERDFGPSDEFLPLEGECFSYSDREYTYKLCPFDNVVQSARVGGSDTRLGNWKGWEEAGRYDTMIYDGGQSCWNGPQRSVKVHLTCGLENQVFNAAEPNKCEYVLDFRTPAACRLPSKTPNIIRDEL